jgi:hypothetical protein
MEQAKPPAKPEAPDSKGSHSTVRAPATADKPAGQPAQKAPKDGEPRPAPRKA